MDIRLLIFFVFLLLTYTRYIMVTGMRIPDEQRLLNKILYRYNPASRPTYNASNSVQIKFQFTLIQIYKLDEVNQVLTTNVWLEQEWKDERLLWNPAYYDGLKTIRVPCEKLWLPDIVLYNSADDFTSGYMQSKAMIKNTGEVFWPPPAKFRSTCKIDITYFPFDDQSCSMKFGSWTYDGGQVDIVKRHNVVDTSNYVLSGEWQLISVIARRNEVTYACCIEKYPDITFTIIIRRRTLYYLFNIILPCLWLTILSLLSFWLPPDSGEKITLGITVLLAFSVFMLLVAEKMPATSEFVPLIGIYLTVIMATTSLSILLTVFVLHIHHIGPHHKKIPPKLRRLFFDNLAPILGMTTVRRYKIRKRNNESINRGQFSQAFTDKFSSKDFLSEDRNHSIGLKKHFVPPETRNPSFSESKTGIYDCLISISNHSTDHLGVENKSNDFSNTFSCSSTPPMKKESIKSDFQVRLGDNLNLDRNLLCQSSLNQYSEIIHHLHHLIERQQEDELDQERMLEWKVMAYILDRFLFWIFATVAGLATIIILLIIPLFK